MRRSVLSLGSVVLAAYACGGEPDRFVDMGSASAMLASANMHPVGSAEWKIAAFTQAAPPEIGANAAVMDWADSTTKEMKELRAGTNGWTCMPSTVSGVGATRVEDTAP